MRRQLIVGYIELIEQMARWQCHLSITCIFLWAHRLIGKVLDVPSVEEDATAVRVRLERVDDVVDLIDGLAVLGRPGRPLLAVDRAEVTVFSCPLIPDADTMLLQPFGIRVTIQEPDHLVDDALEMQLLGGEQREAIFQVVAELATKDTQRACAGAIAFLDAIL